MCRWLAYIGHQRQLDSLLYDQPRSLVHQSRHSVKAKLGVHGDGVGIGWYDRQPCPGLYRDPQPAWSNPNLRDLCHHIFSPLFMAHIRASTTGAAIHLNCHPFRFGKWLFMHNGQIGDFDDLHYPLLQKLTPEKFAMRQGSTDSELMFLLALQLGLCEQPIQALAAMLALIDNLRKDQGLSQAIRATFALSDGKRLYVCRWSSDHMSPSLYLHEEAHGYLVVSEPLDEIKSTWIEVEENQVVSFSLQEDHSVSFEKGVLIDEQI